MIKLNVDVEFSADVVMYCPKPDQANYFHSKYTSLSVQHSVFMLSNLNTGHSVHHENSKCLSVLSLDCVVRS